MTVSETLARHVAAATHDALPGDAVAFAKRLVLDTLGVAWAGADAPGAEPIRKMVLAEGGRPDSALWLFGDRVPALAATFLNGMAAAALDYDSVHEAGSVHPDIVSVPACWALAERERLSGRDFLTAVVLGNDLMCRLGKATARNTGWFYTALHGVFGAAAAAAKLLRLDAAGVRNALGLAFSHAGGTQQALIEKTMAKRLQSAFAARNGVFAALLAQAGASAPKEIFEGKFGFYAKYDQGDPDVLLADLGVRFEHMATAVKKYPSCTANHPAIEGAIALSRELDLRPEDVTGVEVTLSPFSHQLVGAPYDPGANPQVAAQFSIQYSLASAILRRRLAIADIQAEAALDPKARAFAGKVAVKIDETNKGKFAPAEIAVLTRSRGAIRRRIEHVPGTAQCPISEAELHAKFGDCVASSVRPLSEGAVARLIEGVNAIEGVADMSRFFDDVLGETQAPRRARAQA
jgi:2-methylcitrate dehydratase PrpD